MDVRFIWLCGQEDLSLPYQIRQEVFTDEQGFAAEIDVDQWDACAEHILLYIDGKPAGTGRLFPDPQEAGAYHLGRICLRPAYRGKGLGAAMLDQMLLRARAAGARSAVLDAQCSAVPFYQKSGFVPYGEIFDDGGCPHQHMRYTF